MTQERERHVYTGVPANITFHASEATLMQISTDPTSVILQFAYPILDSEPPEENPEGLAILSPQVQVFMAVETLKKLRDLLNKAYPPNA